MGKRVKSSGQERVTDNLKKEKNNQIWVPDNESCISLVSLNQSSNFEWGILHCFSLKYTTWSAIYGHLDIISNLHLNI